VIKKVLVSLIFVVVLLLAGAFFYIDSIVKNGIEVVGSQVLGTAISVASVSISPLSGSGTIRELFGNYSGTNHWKPRRVYCGKYNAAG
jgi:hypothetical protein